MKKVTLTGSLVIEHYSLTYVINQNADGTFHVEAAYSFDHPSGSHKEDEVYKTEPAASTFDNALAWVRKTEREY